jgi:hypothetical protein
MDSSKFDGNVEFNPVTSVERWAIEVTKLTANGQDVSLNNKSLRMNADSGAGAFFIPTVVATSLANTLGAQIVSLCSFIFFNKNNR